MRHARIHLDVPQLPKPCLNVISLTSSIFLDSHVHDGDVERLEHDVWGGTRKSPPSKLVVWLYATHRQESCLERLESDLRHAHSAWSVMYLAGTWNVTSVMCVVRAVGRIPMYLAWTFEARKRFKLKCGESRWPGYGGKCCTPPRCQSSR